MDCILRVSCQRTSHQSKTWIVVCVYHTDYNPCLTPVWGLFTSYTQTTIHVLLWYEVCWQHKNTLQSMSYSGVRFVDKIHADYNPCLTPVWGLLTSYTQTTIHVLLQYEVRWQVTHRLQSMSYSGEDMDCSLCVTCQRASYRSKTCIVVCV
jgi:hypothetical protein